jgi:asparagine synthase (glutamine-hydrolysing)
VAVSGRPAASYSIGFDAGDYDEMEYARLAAKHFGTEHHAYYLTPDDLVRSISRVASHYDQPFGNSSALPAYYCAAMARADGVTRLLAGDGGDELFGGNTRYARQRVLGWYGALPGMMRSHLMEPALANATARRLPLVRKAAAYVDQARVALPERLNLYNLLNRLGMERVFTPDFLQQVDPTAAPAQQWQIWQRAATDNWLQRNLAFDWRYTLAENDLPKVRGTSALAGVDVGFPLLDQRLLDFSLRLPAAYKLRGLKLRWFFKEALRGFLPDAILRKKKHGFGLPFGIWACQHAGLHKLASDSLHTLSERGVVRRDFISTLLTQQLAQHPGYYGEMVWLLMVLEQWLRAHAPLYRSGR